jgi:hypothetical protein
MLRITTSHSTEGAKRVLLFRRRGGAHDKRCGQVSTLVAVKLRGGRQCLEQCVQGFPGTATLPDNEKIPRCHGVGKLHQRDAGDGKAFEIGRDQGDGVFAPDQGKHVRNTGCFLDEFWPEPRSAAELSDPAVAPRQVCLRRADETFTTQFFEVNPFSRC